MEQEEEGGTQCSHCGEQRLENVCLRSLPAGSQGEVAELMMGCSAQGRWVLCHSMGQVRVANGKDGSLQSFLRPEGHSPSSERRSAASVRTCMGKLLTNCRGEHEKGLCSSPSPPAQPHASCHMWWEEHGLGGTEVTGLLTGVLPLGLLRWKTLFVESHSPEKGVGLLKVGGEVGKYALLLVCLKKRTFMFYK